MRTVWSTLVLSCLVGAVGGCQSWSQMGQGLPTGSRVPPPGTGSYPVPSSYYNGQKTSSTGTANSNSTLAGTNSANNSTGAPAPGNVTTAAWQMPTVDQLREGVNNSASAVLNDATSRANQVVQAGTSRAASAVQQYTSPAPAGDAGPPQLTASRSISDNQAAPTNSQPPQLDWQAPR